MKFAVIIGVAHMTLGIVLKAVNARFFYKDLDFYFEFIPQLVLMLATFGYMNLLIIVKWCTYFENKSEAPSIVTFMIDMMLSGGAVKQYPLLGTKTTHEAVNVFLIILMFI
jgi:V-type H+-transporting ATPase subunit a